MESAHQEFKRSWQKKPGTIMVKLLKFDRSTS
jgi:hypothetical protein